MSKSSKKYRKQLAKLLNYIAAMGTDECAPDRTLGWEIEKLRHYLGLYIIEAQQKDEEIELGVDPMIIVKILIA